MRRRDREISYADEIASIIRRSMVCRLAMTDGERPYIVPICFGLDVERLYFHSATEGLKLGIIRRNPNVCFEFDIDAEVVPGERNCEIGMRYRSVIGHGTARIVTDDDQKRDGLNAIACQYGGSPTSYPDEALRGVVIIRVCIESMSGKKSGY